MRKLLLMLWRIWFYLLCTLPVLLLFIPLAFFVTIPNGYKYLYWIARNIWSPFVLFGMGFWIKRLNTFPPEGKSMVIVANHSSYMDIMLMFRMRKTPFVFVGKKELLRLPIFGFFYKKFAIMVNRDSAESRKAVYGHAERRLKQGLGICIFPEGGVFGPEVKLAPFKNGAFRFSIDFQMPIVPMSFLDCEKRYPYHFSYNHFVGGPGILRVRVHNHISTKGKGLEDMDALKQQVYDLLYNDLED
mgnify:CR=1 FL=1